MQVNNILNIQCAWNPFQHATNCILKLNISCWICTIVVEVGEYWGSQGRKQKPPGCGASPHHHYHCDGTHYDWRVERAWICQTQIYSKVQLLSKHMYMYRYSYLLIYVLDSSASLIEIYRTFLLNKPHSIDQIVLEHILRFLLIMFWKTQEIQY